jgi:hypothetical protein
MVAIDKSKAKALPYVVDGESAFPIQHIKIVGYLIFVIIREYSWLNTFFILYCFGRKEVILRCSLCKSV